MDDRKPSTTRRARAPMARSALTVAALAALAAGCGGSSAAEAEPERPEARGEQSAAAATASTAATATAAPDPRPARRRPARPELRIAMGEWAVAPDARAIRPGPVTLVVTNRGRVPHGLELKAESGEGRQGDERLEIHSAVLRPGQTVRMRVTLPRGVYEIECFVADHDDRGMEGLMQVRRDAPRRATSSPAGAATAVRIRGFAYSPRTTTVAVGQPVTWRNGDGAPHTVTQTPRGFASESLSAGDSYTRRFTRAGRYTYFCELHPDMKGAVTVTR